MPSSRCEPPFPRKIRIPQAGSLSHMYVLTEFDALGLENEGLRLWLTLYRVRDWFLSPPEGAGPPPGEPDRPYDEVDATLRPVLTTLDRLLAEPSPDEATGEAVAAACLGAALWAEGKGAYHTVLGFLHAAEDVDPENPHYAYNLGRVARKLAMYDESSAWLKWAHHVARGSRRWEVATLALSGLGNLHRQRGSLPRATRYHEAARRMARLRGLRTLEGDALYDLAIMSFSFGEATKGAEYAKEALKAYGPGHSQVYRLAKDAAWFWMDHYGRFENAAHVFIMLMDHVWDPSYRVLLCANLARAAAGAGWVNVFEEMWVETWGMIHQQLSRQGHAAALIQLALGAGSLGCWDRSVMAATEALTIATGRKETELLVTADRILKALDGGVIDDCDATGVFKDRQRMEPPRVDASTTDLTALFSNAMKARRDDAPESPIRDLVYPEGSLIS